MDASKDYYATLGVLTTAEDYNHTGGLQGVVHNASILTFTKALTPMTRWPPEQGHASAQYNLGRMYYLGQGSGAFQRTVQPDRGKQEGEAVETP